MSPSKMTLQQKLAKAQDIVNVIDATSRQLI